MEDPRIYRGQPRNLLYSSIGFDPFAKQRELWIPSDRTLFDVMERPDQFTEFVQLSFIEA